MGNTVTAMRFREADPWAVLDFASPDTERVAIAEDIPASLLEWAGASQEQLAFMRRVYERQVSHAARLRPFVDDVPARDLDVIEDGHRARRPAAAACRELLAAARAVLEQEQRAGDPEARVVTDISVVSAYRSASSQFEAWQRNFPRYYGETRARRVTLDGGEHGAAAVRMLASFIGGRLAAPGYGLHNDGRAVDFGTTEAGRRLGAQTAAANIRGWRASWLYRWLTRNAARFAYRENTAIDEPWHWEHRLEQREGSGETTAELDSARAWPPERDSSAGIQASDGPEIAETVAEDGDIEARTLVTPASVDDERFADGPENWLPAPVHVVLDRDARIRSGPPDFRSSRERIPYWTRVWLNEERGQYVRVTGADGTVYGWTQASNIGTFFKDLPHLLSAPLPPPTPVVIGPSWSALRKALAATHNRLGGLMAYMAVETGIRPAAVLAVWYVESAGRSHTVGRALIRFENHLFFDRWGSAHPDAYDRHFQHGGRAGIAGRRWENHRWRDDPARPFARFHGDQDAEYRVLAFATTLSDEPTALSCISIGGPQILISHYRTIGYDAPRAMYDAFQAGEAAQALGFFDYCQFKYGHRARRGELLRDLAALRWEDFTRGYNGSGQVAHYSGRLRSAYDEAVRIVPATSDLNPPPSREAEAIRAIAADADPLSNEIHPPVSRSLADHAPGRDERRFNARSRSPMPLEQTEAGARLVLRLQQVKIGKRTPIDLAPGTPGTYEGFFRRPLPEGLAQIVLTGRIEVEEAGRRRPYTAADHRRWRPRHATAEVPVGGATGLTSSTSHVARIARDGSFDTETIVASDSSARGFRLRVTVSAKAGRRLTAWAVVELADLAGFLDIVDAEEQARSASQTHLEFLASVRKIYQGGPRDPLEGAFDLALYRSRDIAPLFGPNTADATRLRHYAVLYADGSTLDIGHVLCGIEGSPAQDPQRGRTGLGGFVGSLLRPELLVTWAGDLGSALYEYTVRLVAATEAGAAIDLADYLSRYAARTDLIGDIDGINIGAVYDPGRSLGDNLNVYYGATSRRRHHQFIANSKDPSGSSELPLVLDSMPPRLSLAARQAIGDHTLAFVAARVLQNDPFSKLEKSRQERAHEIIAKGSPEVGIVVDHFVRFLEEGLARE